MRIPANVEHGYTNPKTSKRIGCPIGTEVLFTRHPRNSAIAEQVWRKSDKRRLAGIVSIAGLQFKMPGRQRGSKRRGRNASNLTAAATLVAYSKPPVSPAQPVNVQLGRSVAKDFACDVCGKDIRSCRGTGPYYTRIRRRLHTTSMAFIG